MLPVGVEMRKPSAMAVVRVRWCGGEPIRMVMWERWGSAPRCRRTSFSAKMSWGLVVEDWFVKGEAVGRR